MTKINYAVDPSKPDPYELIAEVSLKNDNTINIIPRVYIVNLLIYLPQSQSVVSYQVTKAGQDDADINETISLRLDPKKVTHKQVWAWKSYEFEIEKMASLCKTLSIDIDPIGDPKPKVVFLDPIELDPDTSQY